LQSGVSVIFTPGHSLGLQGVLVESGGRKCFIASDTIPLYRCLESDPPLINGIFVNLPKYYESLKKIKELSADIILPGHDFKVLEKETYSVG
jgi:N-acyl homoserine lactone hydrolase